MDNLYDKCESWFWGMIGAKLSKEQKDVDNAKLYKVGWKGGKGGFFFCEWEKLSSYFAN
jgi:hypothetical protein